VVGSEQGEANRNPGEDSCAYGLEYPRLAETAREQPVLPSQWFATAILHPFSPPPAAEPKPDLPFFQLCVANVEFVEGAFFAAQITGCEYGTWWYNVSPSGTEVSRDEGRTWTSVDLGWSMPTTNWFGDQAAQARCAGSSYLNWMQAQKVDWWKSPVPRSKEGAATWMWFDSKTQLPFRLMFGYPPPAPGKGDPTELALFQMFSFTYFASFEEGELDESKRGGVEIPGFASGNPKNYELVEWNHNFGMTTFMTPVSETFNPLPTRVLYHWAEDQDYKVLTDRAQNTLMWFTENPSDPRSYESVFLYGVAPRGVPAPPHSDRSFQVDVTKGGSSTCEEIKPEGMNLGLQPPNWASLPAAQGAVHACIEENAALCPKNRIAVIAVLFPPTTEYPQGRYLWTWYSPFPDSGGRHARPVTFMESASSIAEGGTNLALADYYDYRELAEDISPGCLTLPGGCPG
jgi:hypothetical protein